MIKIILSWIIACSVYAQTDCTLFQYEASFWYTEYSNLRAYFEKQEESVAPIEDGAEFIQEDDLQIGYFYYDKAGNYLYKALR